MDLRTKICIWVIILGMVNFLAYAVAYAVVGGESVRGKVYEDPQTGRRVYYLDSGKEVGHDAFLYMGIHSITIWVTVAAIMLSMLTLAKDRVADSMQSAAMRGRTFCTVMAVLIGFCTAGLTFLYVREFIEHFEHPLPLQVGATATSPASLPAPTGP